MAQTTFKLAVSGVDQPATDGSPSANPSSTPTSTKPGTANTGFETLITKDVVSTVSSPVVSGAFIFAGIILLLALVAKMKKNKQAGFKSSLTRKHYTTRILGFAAFLALIAGIGGTAVRFMGAKATDTMLDGISVPEIIEAEAKQITDDYGLYCGTGSISLNSAYTDGYQLSMYTDGKDDILPSGSDGIADIASVDNWDGLGIGEWGYYIGTANDWATATINPIPQNIGVIDNHSQSAAAGATVPLTFCAKVSRNVEEAEFSADLDFLMIPGTTNSIDYNSAVDSDGDGISNRLENRYGMDPSSTDSDIDGLDDYAEFYTHGTNPLSIDTDGDGLYDYSEVKLNATYGTDPKVADYDGTTSFTYTEAIDDDLSFTVTGTGNIPMTTVDVAEPSEIAELLGADETSDENTAKLESFSSLPGKVYLFDSAGEVTSATIIAGAIETEEEATEDDDTLGIPVSEDFNANHLYGASLTFDENDAAVVTDVSESIDTTTHAGKISLPITSNSAIVLVGDASQLPAAVEEGELGSPLVSPAVAVAVAVAIEGFKALVQAINDAGGLAALTAKFLSLFKVAYANTPNKVQARRMTSQQKANIKVEFSKFIADEITIWRPFIAELTRPCNAAARAAGYTGEGYLQLCVPYVAQTLAANLAQLFRELSGIQFTQSDTASLESGIEESLSTSSTSNTKKSVNILKSLLKKK